MMSSVVKHIIMTSLLLSLFHISIKAEVADSVATDKTSHYLGFNIRPSYILVSHPFWKDHNSSEKPMIFSGSAHLQYAFGFSPESHLGKLYPGVIQGIGIGGWTFLNNKEVGSPVSLYLFQTAPIVDLGDDWHLGYEWNLGVSLGWKENVCIASFANAYINLGLLFKYDINPHWTFSIGPEYTHFSNGDTKFPNGGANTIGIRAGVTASLTDIPKTATKTYIKDYESAHRSRKVSERMMYDILAYGAWRADTVVGNAHMYHINERFPVAGIHFNPLYKISRNFGAGVSLDLTYDSSANLYGHKGDEDNVSYLTPPLREQLAAGISVRGEVTMSIFSINLGPGINFLKSGNDMKWLYTVFNLKTFVSERLFILTGYRFSSLQNTHNLMFGIGYRIHKS